MRCWYLARATCFSTTLHYRLYDGLSAAFLSQQADGSKAFGAESRPLGPILSCSAAKSKLIVTTMAAFAEAVAKDPLANRS